MMTTGVASILLLALAADAASVTRVASVDRGFTKDCEQAETSEFVITVAETESFGVFSVPSAEAVVPLSAGTANQYTVCVKDSEVEATLEALQKSSAVRSIDENFIVRAYGEQSVGANLWNLDRIDQKMGMNGKYAYAGEGAGVTVYVADTGSSKHRDFNGRMENGHDATGRSTNGNGDRQAHGTHCAGTIGSTTYGVAKGVQIVPVKVLGDDGSGSFADILKGINYATDDNRSGPKILSMSLGGKGAAPAGGNAALQRAKSAGVITVVAAGNDNTDACGFWPASSSDAITVGSTDKRDSKSSFSNYGTCVDVYAPGSDITSTSNVGSGTKTMSGTSMACPATAGVVAVMAGLNPSLTPASAKSQLRANGVALGGRVDHPFVQVPTGPAATPEPTPAPATPRPTPIPATPQPTPIPATPRPTPPPATPKPTPVPSTCRPDYAGKVCNACLATNDVCYTNMNQATCVLYPGFEWCA